MPARESATLEAGSRLGPYEILERIGAGPMAEVYRARDAHSGRIVALKVLPRHLSAHPAFRAWLASEARLAARLEHPSICAVVASGRAGEVDYVAMEYLEGESLVARLKRGPLAPSEALGIARRVAEALEAAHACGIVHSDLKPANVMLLPAGAVKVLDFGLARPIEEPVTGSGHGAGSAGQAPGSGDRPAIILGTPACMSPEQARGEPLDAATDVWALGVVLFEALTGVQPFLRPSARETLRAIQSEDPDWGLLPPDTGAREVVRRALERDRTRRWGSVRAMRMAIEDALGAGTR